MQIKAGDHHLQLCTGGHAIRLKGEPADAFSTFDLVTIPLKGLFLSLIPAMKLDLIEPEYAVAIMRENVNDLCPWTRLDFARLLDYQPETKSLVQQSMCETKASATAFSPVLAYLLNIDVNCEEAYDALIEKLVLVPRQLKPCDETLLFLFQLRVRLRDTGLTGRLRNLDGAWSALRLRPIDATVLSSACPFPGPGVSRVPQAISNVTAALAGDCRAGPTGPMYCRQCS